MKIVTKLMLLLALTTFTSCATIINGTTQRIGIASTPSSASVWLDRQLVGKTPLIVEMTRKDNHHVIIELDGYQPYEATFSRKLSGWVFGNIAIGGFIGLAIDAISGGIYVLTPEQIQAELCTNNIAYSKNSKESFIAIVLQPDPSWQKVGNLTSVN
jgi:hypothetical protein